ncbi:MAG: mechanosensitive ion channel [Nanoarchaeota archaeon]|nr:mechanosensitive ion channel [Nanoarchaeota archaeon]
MVDFLAINNYVHYIYAVVILLVFLTLARITLVITDFYLRKIAHKTRTDLDDIIVKRIRWPVYYFFIIWGITISLIYLKLPENIEFIIKKILYSIIIFFFALVLIQVVLIIFTRWIRKRVSKTSTTIDDELLPLFENLIKILVIVFALLYILKIWGVEITPLLAGLGIAGLAVGLALQDTLGNIFSGVSIIADRYFKVGDVITLESGETGKIQEIGIRSTKIRTWDEEVMIIPNSQLANKRIINYAKPGLRARISLDFGVVYGSDPDKVKKVVLDAVTKLAKKEKHILTESHEPEVFFTEMADYALKFSLKVHVDDYKKRYGIKDKLNTEVYAALRKAKIGIPFPTRTVYVKKG